MSADPFSLYGKRILVTGASSGLGRAIAISCAQQGATIVVTGRDEGRLQETLAALNGGGHSKICADLLEQDGREEVAATAGTVHGVVHSAGISAPVPVRMMTSKHLREIWQTNYEAPVLLTQRLLSKQQIVNGGSILFLSSIAALIGTPATGAYSGSKAALIATMRCLAMEVAKRRIRANCLAPGMVETPLLVAAEQTIGSAGIEAHRAAYPLGFGNPEDVGNAAIFFMSDASRWITGTTLTMDGGSTIP